MKEESIKDSKRNITEKDLPLTIKEVSKNDVAGGWESLGNFVLVIGAFIVLYGIYMFMSGPDSMKLGYSTLTFLEYLKLNPQYIILVGAFTLAFGNAFKNLVSKKTKEYIEENFLLRNASGKPAKNGRLLGAFNEDNHLVLQFQAVGESSGKE